MKNYADCFKEKAESLNGLGKSFLKQQHHVTDLLLVKGDRYYSLAHHVFTAHFRRVAVMTFILQCNLIPVT